MIDVEIPGAPPLLLNARLHWRDVNKGRKKWHKWTALALHGKVPPEPWERACIVFTRRTAANAAPDFENLASGFKWVLDAVVRAGVVVDDSPDHVELYYQWEKALPKRSSIRIQAAPIRW